MFSPLLQELIDALRCLPGVGPKSAQRMALQLLERQRENGLALSATLKKALIEIKHCTRCRNFCETELCQLCTNPRRNSELLCIVETPADVIAIDHTGHFRGLYFVLMGHLSPLDGIGPEQIGINELNQRLAQEKISEVILATNPTVEGEATAHYLANIIHKFNIPCSRLAHGVPMGGELEYLDNATLSRAFSARTKILTST